MLANQVRALKSPALRQITLEVLKVNGINLGQGVCQLPVPEPVLEAANRALTDGINRYTNPRGLASLRTALAKKLETFNGIVDLDPEKNILVTCGATGAFEGACASLLNPGDEVVVFEPYYPYHVQALRRYQADIKYVPLSAPNWQIDFDELRRVVGASTKFILLNTPGNPNGKVFTREELTKVAEIIEPYPALLVTDEIYEHMTFDGRTHVSPASLPQLKNKTITMGGYSKTFSITGWRIGYMVVPSHLSEAFAALLDAVYVCAPAPLQEAVAQGIEHFGADFYRDLNAKYEGKRDRFAAGLRAVGLDPIVPQGAYYMLSAYDRLAPGVVSTQFVSDMIRKTGVGAVPSSDFVRVEADAPWIRFCLALEDNILDEALDRLSGLSK